MTVVKAKKRCRWCKWYRENGCSWRTRQEPGPFWLEDANTFVEATNGARCKAYEAKR